MARGHTAPSSKLNIVESYNVTILKIICHMFYLMILGQDSSNHIGPLKTLPPEYFVCYIYWETLTKLSSETYQWTFLKRWICTLPIVHLSLWLYKMCQIVVTFFCVKFSPKLQETHFETEPPSAGWKHSRILYYFIFVCEIRDILLVFG